MNQLPKKFYWHANTSSGGTLSLDLNLQGDFSKNEKEKALADALAQAHSFMINNGDIPFKAKLLSSSDIAENYGHTRQYWEKLLNEGKILYKETSAGRITTDLWMNGYLGKKEEVDGYVRNVKKILLAVKEARNGNGTIICPQCGAENFQYHINFEVNTNGVCRSCNFYVHTTNS